MITTSHVETILSMKVGTCLENEPLYKHTTFRVGGPCRLFVDVKDLESLQRLMAYVRDKSIPYYFIGFGSNVLFADKEFEGVVISMTRHLRNIQINGCEIEAEAGAPLGLLCKMACDSELSGLEFAGGIPGSVGGAVFMNAGAYLSDMSALIQQVTYLDENGTIQTISKDECQFSYRHSIFQEHPSWQIISCKLHLAVGTSEDIQALMDRRKEKRLASQPYNKPSAGSVFRNPEGHAAWQLIDACGLRGKEIGGAQVSHKHSNFIVNNGYASSKDILDLITLVQTNVKANFGIDLHTEVRLVNW